MKYEEKTQTIRTVVLTLSEEESRAIRRALYQARMNLLKERSTSTDIQRFESLRNAMIRGEHEAERT